MAEYKLLGDGRVLKRTENLYIPDCMDNGDWKRYQKWLSKGNIPDPADPPRPEPTLEEKIDRKVNFDPVVRGLLEVLAERFGVTKESIIADIKDKQKERIDV